MPANNSNAHKLAQRYPGRVGILNGLESWAPPRGLPFALDNGRFSVWAKGKEWDESFVGWLMGLPPQWAIVSMPCGPTEMAAFRSKSLAHLSNYLQRLLGRSNAST